MFLEIPLLIRRGAHRKGITTETVLLYSHGVVNERVGGSVVSTSWTKQGGRKPYNNHIWEKYVERKGLCKLSVQVYEVCITCTRHNGITKHALAFAHP